MENKEPEPNLSPSKVEGEKPDFFGAAKKYATNVSADPDKETPDWIITDFEAGANHVWDTYVAPLHSRIKGLEQERDAALSERDEILNRADMRIKELESSQSWVSVKERYPEHRARVMAYGFYGCKVDWYACLHMKEPTGSAFYCLGNLIENVTFWRPLPSKPE